MNLQHPYLTSAAFLGKCIVSVSSIGTIRMWTEDGQSFTEIETKEEALDVKCNKNLFFVNNTSKLQLWSTGIAGKSYTFDVIRATAFNTYDDNILLVASYNIAKRANIISKIFLSDEKCCECCEYSRDVSAMCFVGENEVIIGSFKGELEILDIECNMITRIFYIMDNSSINCIAHNKGSGIFVVGCSSGVIYVWDLNGTKWNYKIHNDYIWSVAINENDEIGSSASSEQSSVIASCSGENVKLFNIKQKKIEKDIKCFNTKKVEFNMEKLMNIEKLMIVSDKITIIDM